MCVIIRLSPRIPVKVGCTEMDVAFPINSSVMGAAGCGLAHPQGPESHGLSQEVRHWK